MELRDNDRLDHWLDGALRQYGSAEPRAGLERRILTNLATDRRRVALRWRWGLALVSTAATGGIVVLWMVSFLHHPRGANKSIAAQIPIENSIASHTGPQSLSTVGVEAPVKAVHPHTREHKRIEQAREPRLEKFPAPRPLSEQEELLMQFVRHSPQEAVLVAQMQAKRQKELDRLIADQVSESERDQQER